MRTIRERLQTESEGGLSLIEIVIALMIFAMVSMGLIYSMLSIIGLSRDSRARQVATNLAAEEIDKARGTLDIINDLGPLTTIRQLNGDEFTITRTVEWVSDPNSELKCGASTSGDNLRYKKVNVRVSWGNMQNPANAVQSDTVINPRERINDPNKGTILVTVLKSDGTGASGVTVTASPSFATAVSATDSQGCTFVLKVNPGTYSVSLSKTGYVDEKNNASATKSNVVVTAGSTVSLPFQYDLAATYLLSYPVTSAPNNAQLPNGLNLSFINTYRTHVSTQTGTVKMHPDLGGYTIVAGDVDKCAAANPYNWPIDSGMMLVDAPLSYSGAPGATVAADVALGTVAVTNVNNRWVHAESAAGAAGGDCTSTVSYTFQSVSGSNRTIALPYGAWKLSSSSSQNGTKTTIGTVVVAPETVVIP